MKESWIIAAGVIASLTIIVTVLWIRFAISNVAASVVVFDAEPGVRCVRVTTADGVAVDCWRIKQ